MCFPKVWASTFLPNEPAKKDATQKAYYEQKGSVMLVDYAALEMKKKVCTRLIILDLFHVFRALSRMATQQHKWLFRLCFSFTCLCLHLSMKMLKYLCGYRYNNS